MNNDFRPQIDYSHVLSELSVNRQDPCELLRELISNSYDAKASDIWYYPLEEYHGVIFIDNGTGLTLDKDDGKEISNYEAFFSIGKTTKVKGDAIGYKCQGAKLCFASSEVTVLSKIREKDGWIYKRIDNPRTNLNINTDITPSEKSKLIDVINEVIPKPDVRTIKIINDIVQNVCPDDFDSGTIIIIKELSVDQYSKYYTFNNSSGDQIESSYVYNYIRFCTKHGDVRIVNNKHGFSSIDAKQLDEVSKDTKGVSFSVWNGESIQVIEQGYPYLDIDTKDSEVPLLASKLSRLRSARFYARKAKVIRYQGQKYSIIFAMDGNRRALEKYANLDRQGATKSGMKLSEQRGTYISSQGIKTCNYNQLWLEPSLSSDYACLYDNDSQSHYLFIIDGPFDLVTNRNSISNDAFSVLKDPAFINQIKDFLETAKVDLEVFRDYIDVLNKRKDAQNISEQIRALDETKSNLAIRERFMIKNIPLLEGKWFIAPDTSDEHWVGALYSILSNFVPEDSPYKNLWLRPLTFSARGIDSVGVSLDEKSFNKDVLKSIEYKNRFSHHEVLNHPLNIIDYIVCWDYEEVDFSSNPRIDDEFNMFGTICKHNDDDLNSCGYLVCNVEKKTGEIFDNDIYVISLRSLIVKTFECRVSNKP
ncbi:ATP-binding protein [Dickeya zeae]|nr:ATP-binding protein [Dickeya zeae]